MDAHYLKRAPNTNPVLDTSLDILLQKYPDLEQIITSWPELSKQAKKAVLDIVREK